jgi:hypothetical protein
LENEEEMEEEMETEKPKKREKRKIMYEQESEGPSRRKVKN